jgi:hypothetical protein
VAQELRSVPPGNVTHPDYFFWGGESKRKSEVSNWERTFTKIVAKARETYAELFIDNSGEHKPAHLDCCPDAGCGPRGITHKAGVPLMVIHSGIASYRKS